MADKKGTPPFLKSVAHLQELFDIDFKSALESVQDTYARFKNRNQKLIERQNDLSNNAQVQLISHFALLATLTLTVVGFLLTQTTQSLTDNQQVLILVILGLEIASLTFGAADYLQTILFHQRWARLYQDMDKEIDKKFETGELEWTNDINKIEAKHLKKAPETTKMWVTYIMVALCIIGLALLLLLFCAYFYDIPFVR
jgi:hypothetical protein